MGSGKLVSILDQRLHWEMLIALHRLQTRPRIHGLLSIVRRRGASGTVLENISLKTSAGRRRIMDTIALPRWISSSAFFRLLRSFARMSSATAMDVSRLRTRVLRLANMSCIREISSTSDGGSFVVRRWWGKPAESLLSKWLQWEFMKPQCKQGCSSGSIILSLDNKGQNHPKYRLKNSHRGKEQQLPGFCGLAPARGLDG